MAGASLNVAHNHYFQDNNISYYIIAVTSVVVKGNYYRSWTLHLNSTTMMSMYQMVKSCIVKTPSQPVDIVTKETQPNVIEDLDQVKENDANDFESNKKTDEQAEQKAQSGGIIWRMSSGIGSGLYNVTTGAVGYGVGGVKWVAGKGYDAGAAVVSHVKVPVIPKLKKQKDKSE